MRKASNSFTYFSVPGGTLIYAPHQAFPKLHDALSHQNTFRVYPGLDSVMVFHDENLSVTELELYVHKILNETSQEAGYHNNVPTVIPVWYDENSKDWSFLEDFIQKERTEIIEIHQKSSHIIDMYGFLPGFPYIRNEDVKLEIPRKKTPDRHIIKGSVALAGNYTGIYPVESPGGWHVIGRCPLLFLDPANDSPIPYPVGTTIQFESISESEFNQYHDTKK